MKYILVIGIAFLAGTRVNRPTLTYQGSNWTLEHISMPPCPDSHKRTVHAPEKDEVDALSVSCEVR